MDTTAQRMNVNSPKMDNDIFFLHCVLRAFACVVLLTKRTPRAQAWQRESQFNFPGILTGCWLRIAPSFHWMMEKKQGKNYVKKKAIF